MDKYRKAEECYNKIMNQIEENGGLNTHDPDMYHRIKKGHKTVLKLLHKAEDIERVERFYSVRKLCFFFLNGNQFFYTLE